MALLKIKDARTFDAWCEKHGVTIFSDVGGKYIYEQEFYFKIMKPIIEEMKKKYPDWHERFFSEELIGENPTAKLSTVNNKSKKYLPQGKNEAKYLNKLLEIATKK
ncbi:MAG: hypothetical protein HY063_11580 [Bacteroidetes bacterium]|nr:hypothetical protein [Bacteroidota bacterium]